jgi:three-Cys-motif partner protein
MTIPEEYKGREQTYLKHRVLSEYLKSWAQKWASTIREKKRVRLWYVDCFAGPWQAQDEELEDTSVAIGLNALKQAAETWGRRGQIDLSAVFVEKDKRAFGRLKEFLERRAGPVEVHPLQGEFGEFVDAIDGLISNDPAFLFVDPTGWKGVGMSNIAPLSRARGRDVIINVMFNHINRFKDDARAFLREQMREFFGLRERDVPPGLTEDELFSLYRKQLRQKCAVGFAADLIIPHATHDRTWFRLVMGGHHQAAVELFRDIEKRICGAEAGEVRAEARNRGAAQLGLGLELSQPDLTYARLHEADLRRASEDVLRMLAQKAPRRFGELWPVLLAERHITRTDLGRELRKLHAEGKLVIRSLTGGQRALRDDTVLALSGNDER